MKHPETKIVIVDDHELFTDGLSHLLKSQPEFTVVGEATNAKKALAILKELPADVVLLDMNMPEMDGLTALKTIKIRFPHVHVIILADRSNSDVVIEFMASGAACYFDKSCGKAKLFKAINSVSKDGYYFDSAVSKAMCSSLIKKRSGEEVGEQGLLSDKEMTIMWHICRGRTNKEIASSVHLSVRGVDFYISQMYSKTGCKNKIHLFKYALERELVCLSEL